MFIPKNRSGIKNTKTNKFLKLNQDGRRYYPIVDKFLCIGITDTYKKLSAIKSNVYEMKLATP